MRVVLVTGGFDPIHSGHIEYLAAAAKLGDLLVVGINSDEWLCRKKGQNFMDLANRTDVIRNLKMVNEVIHFNDDDGTAIDAINRVKAKYSTAKVIFANGGDRTVENIPEMVVQGVDFMFGIGGTNKKNSSSWILDSWGKWIADSTYEHTDRVWGWYEVMYQIPGIKVKRLVVMPGKTLSLQRHSKRNEFWVVAEGIATVLKGVEELDFCKGNTIDIPVGVWHQLSNKTNERVAIIEVQYGEACDELDIERQ